MSRVVLRLYITGHAPRTEQAISNLHRMCQTALGDDYELVIIDVLQLPERAEEDRVLATPTLVREFPLPRRCMIGDLSDATRALVLLGLYPAGDSQEASA